MNLFSNASCLPKKRIFELTEIPHVTSGSLSTSEVDKEQQEVRDFTIHWAHAQLSVRAYLTSYLGNRSAIDDCIQEIAILAWNKGPRGPVTEPFVAFCLACAKRIGMAEVKKKYRARTISLSPEVLSSLADTVVLQEREEAGEPLERISALRHCLDGIEPSLRRLLELRYSSRDPAALRNEANTTRKSIDSIYKKLERLRTLLRECVIKKSEIRK